MPPLVAVAVYVTLVPAHIVLDGLAAMDTLAATFGVTVKTTALEVVLPPQDAFRIHLY